MNQIKHALNLSGWKAELGAVMLSVILALLIAFVKGKVTIESFTFHEFAQTAIIVLALAKVQYEGWKRRNTK